MNDNSSLNQTLFSENNEIEYNITCYLNNSQTIVKNIGSKTLKQSDLSDYQQTLLSIDIGSNIEEISENTFENCTNLTNISIPNSVTSIGNYAFAECYYLSSIVLSENIVEIGLNAFQNCQSLVSLSFPDKITQIPRYCCFNCISLKDVSIPNNVSSIELMSFQNCNSLSNISIPNNVISIDACAFSKCASLISLPIPDSVISISQNAFENCTSLQNTNIPNNLTNINTCTFKNCSSLQSIHIPDSISVIESYAFSYCQSLTSITLPKYLNELQEYSLYNCSTIDSISVQSHSQIGNYNFIDCKSLHSIYFDKYTCQEINDNAINWGIGINTDGTVNTVVCYCMDGVTVVNSQKAESSSEGSGKDGYTIYSVKNYGIKSKLIKGQLYWSDLEINKSDLEWITIGNKVTSIEDQCFNNCDELKSIEFSENLTSIPYMCCNSKCLNTIIIHGNITNIGHMAFDTPNNPSGYLLVLDRSSFIKLSCNDSFSNLSGISVPWSKNETYKFLKDNNCLGLSSNYNYYSLTDHHEIKIIYNSSGAKEYDLAIIDPSTNQIQGSLSEPSKYTISYSEDNKYKQLLTGDISPAIIEKNTSFDLEIGTEVSGIYFPYTHYRHIDIPDSVKSIPCQYAFQYTDNLKTLILPNSITFIEQLLLDYSSIEEIFIPKSLKNFRNSNAFGYCPSLKLIKTDMTRSELAAFLIENNCLIHISTTISCIVNQDYLNNYNMSQEFYQYGYKEIFTAKYNSKNQKYQGSLFNTVYFADNGTGLITFEQSNYGILKNNDILTHIPDHYGENIYPIVRCEIGATVTTLCGAFDSNFKYLQTIDIPNTITSIVNDEDNSLISFLNCSSLISLELPFLDYIGVNCFGNCQSLSSITFLNPNEKNKTLEYIICNNCPKLKEIKIDHYDLGSHSFTDTFHLSNQYPSPYISGFNSKKDILSPSYSFWYNADSILNSRLQNKNNYVGICLSENGGYSIISGNYLDLPYTYACDKDDPTITTKIEIDQFNNILNRDCFNGNIDNYSYIFVGNDVKYISADTFKDCTNLKGIMFSDSVLSIGNNAFDSCQYLHTVGLGNCIKDLGDYAFSGCSRLSSIYLPNSLTSIGKSCFENCYMLDYIDIPKSITSIKNSVFCWCEELKHITIPDMIVSIEQYAFYNTGYYNDQDNWEINDYCKALYLNKCLIEFYEYGYDVDFNYKIKDQTITIANNMNENGSHQTSHLSSIELPMSLMHIGDNAFQYFTSISSISIPSMCKRIGNEAFKGCENLISIDIPDYTTDIGIDSFINTKYYNLQSNWNVQTSSGYSKGLYVGRHLLYAGDLLDRTIWQNTYYFLPDTISIGPKAFENQKAISYLTLPDSVTTIGYKAFSRMTNLKTIDMSEQLTKISNNAFYKCNSLSAVNDMPDNIISIKPKAFKHSKIYNDSVNNVLYIGKHLINARETLNNHVLKEDTITIADKAFENNAYISLTIPKNSQLKYIGNQAFIDGPYVELNEKNDIIFGKDAFKDNEMISYDADYLFEKDGYVFGYDQFNSIDCCNRCLSLDDTIHTIADSAFKNCNFISSIVAESSLTCIGINAFRNCQCLKKLDLHKCINLKKIERFAFYDCDELDEIIIPLSTNIEYGRFAFGNTKAMKNSENGIFRLKDSIIDASNNEMSTFISPAEVTSISQYAFANNEKLTTLECRPFYNDLSSQGLKEIKKYAFSGCRNLNSIAFTNYNLENNNQLSMISFGAFNDSSNLTNEQIYLPYGTKNIGKYAFRNIRNKYLELYIPSSIEKIDYNAFINSSNLHTIYFQGKTIAEVKQMENYPWGISEDKIHVY